MTEIGRLREVLTEDIPDTDSRESVFRAANDIADELDRRDLLNRPTGLALGYVQSGKTTAMTALAAECADRGYSVIIALLGVTNLLLSQNTSRLIGKLGIETRSDYRWVSIANPSGRASASEIEDWLGKGRTVLIPVLKNAKRINDLANALASIGEVAHLKCLVIDDEADQASLNTLVRSGEESKVYSAIDHLRSVIARHGYIQFTATPYAPLLLEELIEQLLLENDVESALHRFEEVLERPSRPSFTDGWCTICGHSQGFACAWCGNQSPQSD